MTSIELLADTCARSVEMLKTTLADFSEQELFQRPVPSANNAAWQLGHLIVSESHLVNAVKPGTIELPAGFEQRFGSETVKSDDPKALASKADLLALLTKVRQQSVAWIRTLKEADLAQPAPEKLRQWFPTVGHIVILLGQHVAMHMGQIQVLRRKLGKPVMF